MRQDFDENEPSPLELALRGRPSPAPLPALRVRVLNGVRQELRTGRRENDFLHFAIALAAMLLIGFNLALTVKPRPSSWRASLESRQTIAATASLRQLAPDLSDEDVRRLGILFELGRNLSPLPAPGKGSVQARLP